MKFLFSIHLEKYQEKKILQMLRMNNREIL